MANPIQLRTKSDVPEAQISKLHKSINMLVCRVRGKDDRYEDDNKYTKGTNELKEMASNRDVWRQKLGGQDPI